MKKRGFLLLGGAACLLVAGYFMHAWLTKSPINRDTFERISEGMTLQEVEELIGLPPDQIGYGDSEPDSIRKVSWYSDNGDIGVWISPEGKVTDKVFYPPERESPLDTLRRWIGFPRDRVVILID